MHLRVTWTKDLQPERFMSQTLRSAAISAFPLMVRSAVKPRVSNHEAPVARSNPRSRASKAAIPGNPACEKCLFAQGLAGCSGYDPVPVFCAPWLDRAAQSAYKPALFPATCSGKTPR